MLIISIHPNKYLCLKSSKTESESEKVRKKKKTSILFNFICFSKIVYI